MSKISFLFPGQGSQFSGMGYDLFKEYDFVREIFDAVDEIAKKNISKLCFKGPMEDLNKTIILQPAITAVNLACLSAMQRESGISCDISMGHSLGEYSALRAAKILSLSDTIRSVVTRAGLMEREAFKYKGIMCAIIGLDLDVVETFIRERKSNGIVSVANQNTKRQIVISGSPESVNEVALACKLKSARIIPLKMSGAWHSSLMAGVEEDYTFFLETIKFRKPLCSVIYNLNADVANGINEIKSFLVRQIFNPVLWYDCISQLVKKKIDIFVEIGPGKVLTGLLKKTLHNDYNCKIFNVFDMRSLELFLKTVI